MKKLLLCMILTGLALTAAAGGKKVRYQGELAGGIALEPKTTSPDKWYEITTRQGVRLFDYLFVGAGFSYIARIGTPIDREIPVFGTVRGYLPLGKSRVSLYASCDAGYACEFREGYYRPSIGVDIALSRRMGITLDVGYRHFSVAGTPYDLTDSYLVFTAGFRF